MTTAAPSEIAWTAWPLRRRPGRGALGAVLALGTCWGVADWSRDAWLTVLAVVVLAVSVGPFFVPTTYRLSPAGIEIRRPWRSWRRSWGDFRGVRSNRDLVVLSPSSRRSWLDGIRGETLFVEDNRGDVLAYVERMVGQETGTGSG